MRNIVWTIIVAWIAWKVFNAFASKPKNRPDNQKNSSTSEGEVRIDKNANKAPRFNNNDGEYVDYEEVK